MVFVEDMWSVGTPHTTQHKKKRLTHNNLGILRTLVTLETKTKTHGLKKKYQQTMFTYTWHNKMEPKYSHPNVDQVFEYLGYIHLDR